MLIDGSVVLAFPVSHRSICFHCIDCFFFLDHCVVISYFLDGVLMF